jgi:hypothetical protein
MSGQPLRSHNRVATVVVIAAALFVGGIVVATYAGSTFTLTRTTTLTKTATDSTCLEEIPTNAVFGTYNNATSQGSTVTYSNGTERFFPLNSCPVPVTPDNYRIDSTVESNPKFIEAENGATYEATNGCNCSWGGTSSGPARQYAVLNFVLYGSQRIYPCGNDSYWTFSQLGLILVRIPINSTGLQFSGAEIQALPGNSFFSCTTTTKAP